MTRIFSSLSVIAVLAVIVNLVIGLTSGDYNGTWKSLTHARNEVANLERPTAHATPQDLQTAITARDSAFAAFTTTRSRTRIHMLIGLLAVLLALFVNSLSITYFVGTGKWCKEVCDTYGLDDHWIAESNQTKRRSFPWALLGMTWMGLLAGFGAASDPGTFLDRTEQWVTWHGTVALVTPMVLILAFVQQWRAIRDNQATLGGIMIDVRDARMRRGLPTA